ncbi:MAG: tRNA pseudouridine(55) synthase TruB [Candidatus Omnitrophica bacterium]|nr:tRNA pseudouridine(55) synthase TruB [Candidatus Omnitrophota bacterium]MDE2221862.1 tRNA pseudouridine(55) synthase TruB [Candidatus Omnitrophota bacterium]
MKAAVQPSLQGIVLVNKPAGLTSHDVVGFVRRTFKMRRVGHAGTLDPMATGVLVILLGNSTKLFDKFSSFDKTYRATLRLGLKTTTADITGDTLLERPCEAITEEQVRRTFVQFTGDIDQMPPMVSAVKHQGERLYKIARQGKQVERQARRVRIDELKVLKFSLPEVEFLMSCSKGTYVRQLAEDVGEVLGCGACISQIERTKVGPFDIKDAVTLEHLNEDHILKWSF